MDGPRDFHTKKSKSDKDIVYMWHLKIYIYTYMNELLNIGQKQTEKT